MESVETNDRVALSSEIEAILAELKDRIRKLEHASSFGSVVANETLAQIGEKTDELTKLALRGRMDGLQAIEKMRKLLQQIIATSPDRDQNDLIQLTDDQGLAIKKYVEGIGEEPSGSRIVDDTPEKQELRMDLPGTGIISLMVFLSGPTVLAWKLDRQKTKEESQNLAKWLDRLLDQRSQEIILNVNESVIFLRTFKIEQSHDCANNQRNITTPRTFANVTLSDGRKVCITFSSVRTCDKYIATWKESEKP